MLGYGHDESAPTPGGVFRNQFRGGRGELTGCFATNFVGVKGTFIKCSQRVRNLFDIHS